MAGASLFDRQLQVRDLEEKTRLEGPGECHLFVCYGRYRD